MSNDRTKSFSILVVPFVMAGIGLALHQAVLTGTSVPRMPSLQLQAVTFGGTAVLHLLFWLLCLGLAPATYDKTVGWVDPLASRAEWLRRTALSTTVVFWIGCIGYSISQFGWRFGLVNGAVSLALVTPGLLTLSLSMQEASGRNPHPEKAMGQGLNLLLFAGIAIVAACLGLFNAR